jgi:hypothetical protein
LTLKPQLKIFLGPLKAANLSLVPETRVAGGGRLGPKRKTGQDVDPLGLIPTEDNLPY